MVKLVENEEVNVQINYIFKLHNKGKSDQQIAAFFIENREMNLKTNTFDWSEKDITIIRQGFEERYKIATGQKKPKISGPKHTVTPVSQDN